MLNNNFNLVDTTFWKCYDTSNKLMNPNKKLRFLRLFDRLTASTVLPKCLSVIIGQEFWI